MSATAAAERRARMLELVEKGLSFEEIALELKGDEEAGLLRRAALFRRLDAASLKLVLVDPEEDPAARLDALRAAGRLEPAAGQPGALVFRAGGREALLSRWDVVLDPSSGRVSGADADELRDLSRRLADHFAGRGESWELDHLHHLLAADAAIGILRMEELLRGFLPQPNEATGGALPASDAGDGPGLALGRAFDVLEIVEKQLRWVPAAGKESYNAARRQVETWLEWSDAWYRTRRYVARPRVHGWFFELLAEGAPRRILELHAPGGSGKTMALRWLATHHHIPRRHPFAHLDFDQYLGSVQRPWELLLRCAEQLDRQIPGAPFASLIAESKDLQASLASLRQSGARLDAAHLDSFEIEFPQRFSSILLSLPIGVVTIVVDTFEEAMLRGLTPVPAFVASLVMFLRSCPRLRLILSGRYPLRHGDFEAALAEKFPREHQFLLEQRRTERLPQFGREEAAVYLAGRGLRLEPDQLERIFTEAGHPAEGGAGEPELSPFYLALLADLLEHRAPGQDLGLLLENLGQVRLIHLIERVLARIEDVRVRWLLRYGSAPRRLTRDFFAEVLLPHLKRVHGGRSPEDDPSRDPWPEPLRHEKLFFSEGELLAEGDDGAALWERLRRFAATDAWVEEKGDALVFHANAREPMLALLRKNRALRRIHGASAAFFQRRGREAGPGEERALLLRQAVFHRFQLADPDLPAGDRKAAIHLEELMDAAAEAEDFVTVVRLGEEIAGEDYRPDGAPALVEADVVAAAQRRRFHAALALADSAAEPASIDAWLFAAGEALGALKETSPAPESDELTAMILVRQTIPSREPFLAAVELFRRAPPSPERERSLALAWQALADRRCVGVFARLLAARLNDDEPSRQPLKTFLIAALATAVERFGVTAEEIPILETATGRSWERPSRHRATLAVGWLLRAWRRGEAAGAWARRAGADAGELELIALLAEGQSQPAAALEGLRRFVAARGAEADRGLLALAAAQEAWLGSLLGDAAAVVEALGRAAERYGAAGRPDRAAQIFLVEARFWLHHHGDAQRSREAVNRLLRSVHGAAGREETPALPERLLIFELHFASGAEAADFDGLLIAAEGSDVLADRLAAAITLLATLPRHQRHDALERIAELLLSSFERQPDFVARASYPWLLREAQLELRLSPEQDDRLRHLLAAPRTLPARFGEQAGQGDRAWARLAHAHLLRVFGHRDLALQGLNAARDVFKTHRSAAGMREVWQLEALLGRHFPGPEELAPFAPPPTLVATIAVEQAEMALARRDDLAARRWMADVNLALPALRPGRLPARGEGVLAELARRAPAARFPASRGIDGGVLSGLESISKAPAWPDAVFAAPPIDRHPNLDQAMAGGEPPAGGLDELFGLHARQMVDLGPSTPKPDGPPPIWIARLLERESGQAGLPWVQELLQGFRAAPLPLVEMVARRPELFAGEILEAILGPQLPRGLGETFDLAVTGEHLSGAALPWELGRRGRLLHHDWPLRLLYRAVDDPSWRILWLQQALRAAGLELPLSFEWDAPTAEALRRFGNERRSAEPGRIKAELIDAAADSRRPLRVAILQPSASQQKGTQRGLGFGGVELGRLYHQQGMEAKSFQGLSVADFLERPESRETDVVHVHAPYIELRSLGDVAPNLGGRKASTRSVEGQYPPLPKLLILDGPAEPEPVEQVRQLFLRNAAASLLARNPFFPNILAMGLEVYPDFDRLGSFLAALARRRSFRDLYRTLADAPPELDAAGLHQATGRLAPALWSADPDLSVLPGDFAGGTP